MHALTDLFMDNIWALNSHVPRQSMDMECEFKEEHEKVFRSLWKSWIRGMAMLAATARIALQPSVLLSPWCSYYMLLSFNCLNSGLHRGPQSRHRNYSSLAYAASHWLVKLTLAKGTFQHCKNNFTYTFCHWGHSASLWGYDLHSGFSWNTVWPLVEVWRCWSSQLGPQQVSVTP